jgi:hypothetical protein
MRELAQADVPPGAVDLVARLPREEEDQGHHSQRRRDERRDTSGGDVGLRGHE